MKGVKTKGSQRWLQVAVNRCPCVIEAAIRNTGLQLAGDIEWVSPLESKGFKKYPDSLFVKQLRIRLDARPLKDFWPRGGPRWGGLARWGNSVLLVEAKAHIGEPKPTACRAKGDSLAMIEKAMLETKKFLQARPNTDWTGRLYRYANRLALLYLLRKLNGLDAYLLNVYFTDDKTSNKPASRGDWDDDIMRVKEHLGLPNQSSWLASYAKDVFIDVRDMEHIEWPPREGLIK